MVALWNQLHTLADVGGGNHGEIHEVSQAYDRPPLLSGLKAAVRRAVFLSSHCHCINIVSHIHPVKLRHFLMATAMISAKAELSVNADISIKL